MPGPNTCASVLIASETGVVTRCSDTGPAGSVTRAQGTTMDDH
jgi:hypothetical protein